MGRTIIKFSDKTEIRENNNEMDKSTSEWDNAEVKVLNNRKYMIRRKKKNS